MAEEVSIHAPLVVIGRTDRITLHVKSDQPGNKRERSMQYSLENPEIGVAVVLTPTPLILEGPAWGTASVTPISEVELA